MSVAKATHALPDLGDMMAVWQPLSLSSGWSRGCPFGRGQEQQGKEQKVREGSLDYESGKLPFQ